MKISLLLLLCPFLVLADDLEKEKELSRAFLAEMAKEPGAEVTPEGVVVRAIFRSPSAVYPKDSDTVGVSYHLSDREGILIEESISSDEVISFPLNRLIKCWRIAIPKMSVGSYYKISCPSDTAYGDRGAAPSIKPGAALVFRVTLFSTQP